jgi:hypothetical protein
MIREAHIILDIFDIYKDKNTRNKTNVVCGKTNNNICNKYSCAESKI